MSEVYLRQGWLIKQGIKVKNWKRRYFVLTKHSNGDVYLTYSKKPGGKPKGVVDVLGKKLALADAEITKR